MRLFDFVEKDYRIGSAANRLGQLTALIVAHISRRGAYKTGYGEFLHIFAHIDTHHILLIVKQTFGKGFCKFGFTDARRT